MTPGDLALVDWVDSQHAGAWANREDVVKEAAEETLACQTVGWVLDDTDLYLLVASSQTCGDKPHEQQVDGRMQIPKVAITSVRKLSVARR